MKKGTVPPRYCPALSRHDTPLRYVKSVIRMMCCDDRALWEAAYGAIVTASSYLRHFAEHPYSWDSIQTAARLINAFVPFMSRAPHPIPSMVGIVADRLNELAIKDGLA